jgi:hypothetical protein
LLEINFPGIRDAVRDTDEENEDGDEWEIVVGWLPNGQDSECPEGPIEPIGIAVALGGSGAQALGAGLGQSLAAKGGFLTW